MAKSHTATYASTWYAEITSLQTEYGLSLETDILLHPEEHIKQIYQQSPTI